MKISARVDNSEGRHDVLISTNGSSRPIEIPSRESGFGSSINGGELLCLARATCYCNDFYREAAKRGVNVRRVEVKVDAEFGGEGEAAREINYSVTVESDASDELIRELIRHTDTVAEIQNTVGNGTEVRLVPRI